MPRKKQNADKKPLLFKVGELAKRTGLTVRTLHHYDAIGLLKPSARSPAGYRLYDYDDLGRLHAIQSLRSLGFALNEIDRMLHIDGAPLPDILLRQMQTLDAEIARAQELRKRLALLHDRLHSESKPEANDWLTALKLMSTQGKYFTAEEIRFITQNWKQLEAEWQPLMQEVQTAMQEQTPIDAPQAQALARRWMDLSMRWMQNDFDLLMRWKDMLQKESTLPQLSGADPQLYQYIGNAIELRHTLIRKHLTPDEIRRLRTGLETKWMQLENAAQDAIRSNVPAESEKAQQLVNQWHALMDELTDHDPVIRQKFMHALSNEPLLQTGSPLSVEVRTFIRRAAAVEKV